MMKTSRSVTTERKFFAERLSIALNLLWSCRKNLPAKVVKTMSTNLGGTAI